MEYNYEIVKVTHHKELGEGALASDLVLRYGNRIVEVKIPYRFAKEMKEGGTMTTKTPLPGTLIT